jgi:hypothetical protein
MSGLDHVHAYLAKTGSMLSDRSLAREMSYMTKANGIRHARMVKAVAKETHNAWHWWQLRRLYGNRCCRCGSASRISKDHVIPVSRGGSDGVTNLQPLCKPCNSTKGTRADDCRWDHGEWAVVMQMEWLVGE